MTKPLRFHPAVGGETQEAYNYYADRSPHAAEGFADAIEEAFDAVEAHPERFRLLRARARALPLPTR